jgi:hypothetical protein
MNFFLFGVLLFAMNVVEAQELYVFSEPASNMPAHSVSTKLTTRFANAEKIKQRYIPELMFGINKNVMLHASATFSDIYTDNLRWESVKLYGKYRFFSNDEVHSHFRMAAFADVAYTRNKVLYDELNLDGDHSGVQAGLIATKLVNRLAISGTAAYIKAFNQPFSIHHGNMFGLQALNYSLSAGYLLLPKQYTSYNQTNVNLYVEVLGMQGLEKGDYMLDVAPALQFIFNSNSKLNLGARFQAGGNMMRIANNNYFISVERTFLNALKHK